MTYQPLSSYPLIHIKAGRDLLRTPIHPCLFMTHLLLIKSVVNVGTPMILRPGGTVTK